MFHSQVTSHNSNSVLLAGELYPILCIILLLIGLASPLSSGAQPVPAALNTAAEAGERVYDAARLDDWANASGQVKILRVATRDLLESRAVAEGPEYRRIRSACQSRTGRC